ncbi:putative sodium-dependent multivitamin transporter [Trichonephila clavata]|uniref:Putative sodium-dependent multivitamin transporter n=2 Tax=Trichonephila clavata TaxID=2740835 RepID=A0A8X6G732_TRICU|nr:putative sodium-dependent multivitamin transporter [Trichonephila clavata]
MHREKFVLSAFDYLIFAATLAVSSGIGLFFQLTSKKKTNEEYLLAGKDMTVLPVAFSLMATFMSATVLMGIPAEMYLYGTNMAFMNVGFAIAPIITAYLFLPIFFANDVSTAYEYLEKRFGKTMRRIISAMFAFQLMLFTAATLYAPALALSAVTNLSMWMSVIVIGVVCTFYCTLGGMKAVLWADVFQAVLMFATLLTIVIKGCLLLGGIGKIFEIANEGGRLILPEFSFDLEAHYTMFNVCFQGILLTMSAYGGSQIQVQRLMTLKNLNKSKLASALSAPMVVAFQLLCCVCGLILYAYFRDCDPLTSDNSPIHSADQLMPLFITSTLRDLPGVPGLCICGIFSASLSTVSSAINSLAAVTSEDFLKSIYPKLNITVFHNKILSLVIGALCVGVSFVIASLGSLVKMTMIIVGMVAGPNLGVFLLAACTTETNEEGAILGVLVSLTLAACLSFIPENKTHKFLPLSNECPASNATESNLTVIFSSTQNPTTSFYENSTLSFISETDIEKKPFYLSYMWISSLSLVTCLVVGYIGSLIVSCIKGKSQKVPEIYLSPVRTWFSKKSSDLSDQVKENGTNNGIIHVHKEQKEISVANVKDIESKIQYETKF